MAEIEKRQSPSDSAQGSFHFLHAASNRRYRRIVGGLAWPGYQPGYLIVLGEELYPEVEFGSRMVWGLGEIQEFDADKLLQWAVSFQTDFCCEHWVTDLQSTARLGLLMAFNRRRSAMNLRTLNLSPAADSENPKDFMAHLAGVRSRIISAIGTVNLKACPMAASAVRTVGMAEAENYTGAGIAEKYPAVAGLVWAWADIFTRDAPDRGPSTQTKAENNEGHELD